MEVITSVLASLRIAVSAGVTFFAENLILAGLLGGAVLGVFVALTRIVRVSWSLAGTGFLVLSAFAVTTLLIMPLTDRFEAARSGVLTRVPVPEINRTIFMLPPLRDRPVRTGGSVSRVLTDQPETLVYSTSKIRSAAVADLLLIVDWQERRVAPAENLTPAVRGQLAATEAAIIRRVEAARAAGRPVAVVGTDLAASAADPADSLMRSYHPRDVQVTPALRAALADYADAHFFLKRSEGILGERGDNRETRRALLRFLQMRGIERVRIVGATERGSALTSAAQLLLDPGSSRSYTVLVSPREVADTEATVDPAGEPDVPYRLVPVRALTGSLRYGERTVFVAVQHAGVLRVVGSLTTSAALQLNE